jgi:hypothetical protein
MPNSTSSRVTLRSALESVTFGDHTTATLRRTVRFTGDSLTSQFSFDKSKEIRADRQLANSILMGLAAQGAVNFEMIYKEYDAFLQSALQSTFTAFGTGGPVAVTSPVFTTSTLTQTGGTSFATLAKGQWFQIRGITGPCIANNGIWQNSLTVAATATVITIDSTSWTAGSATGTVTLSSSRLTNGTTLQTYDLEENYTDVTQFLTYRGMGVNKLSIALASKAVITGSFDFMGKDVLLMTATSNLPGTDDVNFPTTFPVMNATSNVAKLYEAGAPVAAGIFVKALSFDLNNALRAQDAIAQLSPVGLGNGAIQLTGKMDVYFANATLFNKAVANQLSSVAFAILDGPANTIGNGYTITLPQITFTGADISVGSLDTDLIASMTFEASVDPLSGKMILIDRFGS